LATSEGKNKAVIDITLDGSYNYNVLLIGEKIELGERITSFRLEALDGENTILLTEGTSVGYLKASRFKECSYKRLRLTLDGIAAPITLRHLAIHRYDEDKSDPESSMVKENLALALSACITVSDDNKEAVINFGGIYPFDTISFVGALWGNYEISAFDGSKFYSISSGFSEDYRVRVHLDEPIITAYQIKIRCDRGFALEPEFKVF
jgi:hypothetical protein